MGKKPSTKDIWRNTHDVAMSPPHVIRSLVPCMNGETMRMHDGELKYELEELIFCPLDSQTG